MSAVMQRQKIRIFLSFSGLLSGYSDVSLQLLCTLRKAVCNDRCMMLDRSTSRTHYCMQGPAEEALLESTG